MRSPSYISREANCILAIAVCMSVPRRIPTLLHGSGCNFGGGMVVVPSSGALLNGFAIGSRVSLLRQQREREMSASASTLCMPG